jgi:hypothetical protein
VGRGRRKESFVNKCGLKEKDWRKKNYPFPVSLSSGISISLDLESF